jgi:hypothetical protein
VAGCRYAANGCKNVSEAPFCAPKAGRNHDEHYSLMAKKQRSRLPRAQRMQEIMQVAAQVFRD